MSSTSSSDPESSNLEDAVPQRSHKLIKKKKLSKRNKNGSKSWKRKKDEMSGSESRSSDSSDSKNEKPWRNVKTDAWMNSDSDSDSDLDGIKGNGAQTSDLENRIPRHDPTIESSGSRNKKRPSSRKEKHEIRFSDEDEDEEGSSSPEHQKTKSVTRMEWDPDAWMESGDSEEETDKNSKFSDSKGKKLWKDWNAPPPQLPPDFEDRIPRYDPTIAKSYDQPDNDKAPTIFTPANYYWKVDEKLRFGEKKEENTFSLVQTFGEPEIKEEIESDSDDELPVYLPPNKRKRSTPERESFRKPPEEQEHKSHYQSGSRFLNKMRIPGELQRYQKENQRPTTGNESFFFKKNDPRFKESREFFSQFVHDEDFENRRRMAKLQLRQRQKKHFKKTWPSQSRRTKAFKFQV